MSGETDVIITFPPSTEARLFPYLSLPMITAYLAQQGVRVVQRDLNIELCHALMTRRCLSRYLEPSSGTPLPFRQLYRRAMAQYLLDHQQPLVDRVFRRQGDDYSEEMTWSTRLVRQGIDLLLESSVLTRSLNSLEEIDVVLRERPDYGDDDAAALLRRMVRDLLNESPPSIFGISVAFFSQLLPAFLLARWVKALSPDTKVILGGQQVLLWGDRLARLGAFGRYVDYLGTGKGEETLLQLSRAVRGECPVSEVADLTYWKESGPVSTGIRSTLRFRDLPPPDYTGLPIRSYLTGETQLALITCIGCYWGRCIFCSYGNRSYRERTYEQAGPKQIAYWCQALVDRYGVHRINFVDENTNLRLVLRGIRLLNDRGYRIRFSTRNRLEDTLLDAGFCRELSDRGCVLMSCGYETNSQRLLDRLNKGVNAANYQRIIDAVSETNITLRLSVMGGLPGETDEEQRASLAFLKRNEHKIGIDVIQMLVAEPGTFLSDELAELGLDRVPGGGLRGNRELSFGMGRVGYSFDYRSGGTFAERLGRFVEIYREVHPQKNDELPPDQLHRAGFGSDATELSGVALLPWVQVHERVYLPDGAEPVDLLVDLLWQRFYHLPPELRLLTARSGNVCLVGREPVSNPDRLQAILYRLIELRLAEPLHEPAFSTPPGGRS